MKLKKTLQEALNSKQIEIKRNEDQTQNKYEVEDTTKFSKHGMNI
jgi:hypothetical protein